VFLAGERGSAVAAGEAAVSGIVGEAEDSPLPRHVQPHGQRPVPPRGQRYVPRHGNGPRHERLYPADADTPRR